MGDSAKTRAVVVGPGPNGLSASMVLALAGYAVTVYEGAAAIGGGARSAELTLPGFVHDVCSAVHPLAACSPCFEQWPLAAHGLEWVHPGAPLAHPLDDGTAIVLRQTRHTSERIWTAHPLDDGTAIVLERSLRATAANLGTVHQAIEAQVERFAPGFGARILARSVLPPAALERHNPNLVGGDFNGGALDVGQFFLRPTRRLYGTPLPGVYLCSASTPPGGGVHGMCGYHAASRITKDGR